MCFGCRRASHRNGKSSARQGQEIAAVTHVLACKGQHRCDGIISGTGDVLEPEGDVIGIGSGGNYALAAGKVLMETDKSAEEIAKKAIKVASEICVFTNDNIKILKI